MQKKKCVECVKKKKKIMCVCECVSLSNRQVQWHKILKKKRKRECRRLAMPNCDVCLLIGSINAVFTYITKTKRLKD